MGQPEMRNPLGRTNVKLSSPLAATLLTLALATPAWAQGSNAAPPEVRSMIEALTPSTTRSMRNLVVRQKTEAEAASAPAASTAAAPAPAPVAVAQPVAPTAAPASAPAALAVAPAAPAAIVVAVPVAAPVAAPTAAPPGPPPSLSLAIQFETNSAQVRPESGRVLGNLVAAMQSPTSRRCASRSRATPTRAARWLPTSSFRCSAQKRCGCI